MTGRAALLLVRHAPTAVTRAFRFPEDEPLDGPGRAAAAGLRGALRAERTVTSPALRCRQTAEAAGLTPDAVDADLAELDFGRWAGRDPHDLWREHPAQLEAWYADPASQAPDGGETFASLQARVVAALDRCVATSARTVVVTHGGPIKAAVLHAVSAPPAAMWHLDVAPCSVTELHARPGGGYTVIGVNRSAAAVSG